MGIAASVGTMPSALTFANSTDFNVTASASADRNRITAEPGFSSSNPGLANVEAALLLPERRLDVCPVTRPGLRWQRPSPAAIKRAKRNTRRNLLAACALMSSQLLAGAQHLRAYSIRYAANSPGSIGLSTSLVPRPGTCPPVVHVERVPQADGRGDSRHRSFRARLRTSLVAETRRRSRSRTAAAAQPPVPASTGRRPVA